MTQWYYSDYERNRLGPVSGRDLADLHNNGQLAPDTLVWREGLSQWQPWRMLMAEVLGAAAPAATAPTLATAAAAGPSIQTSQYNPYAVAERTASASPYAPPRASLEQEADYADDGEVVYAGFWKRFAASMIDSLLLAVVFGILGAVIGMNAEGLITGEMSGGTFALFYLFEMGLMGLYFAWMHASVNQATLGKMAVGIKVTDDDGHRISLLRGFGRYLAYLLSSLILCIGLVMAAFTDRKRALHDMIASTLVVDRWAYTHHPERQRHELGTLTTVIAVLGVLLGLLYLGVMVVAVGVAAAMGGAGG